MVLLLVVLITCMDAHYFWSYALVEVDRTPPGQLICSNMRQNELFRDVIRPAVELLVLNLAPFIMIILALIAVSTFHYIRPSKGQNPLHQFPRSKSVISWQLPRLQGSYGETP